MRSTKKAILLVVLGLLEVVFASWILASNLPRRSADIEAFTRYQNAPTDQNKELWLKERQQTQNEVRLRVFVGICLAAGNLFLIVWVARRRSPSLKSGDALGSPDVPLDV
jgi:hypothetical protein